MSFGSIDMNNLTISNHYNNDDICNAFLCASQGGMFYGYLKAYYEDDSVTDKKGFIDNKLIERIVG